MFEDGAVGLTGLGRFWCGCGRLMIDKYLRTTVLIDGEYPIVGDADDGPCSVIRRCDTGLETGWCIPGVVPGAVSCTGDTHVN